MANLMLEFANVGDWYLKSTHFVFCKHYLIIK